MATMTNVENPYMTEAVSVARVISETLSAYRGSAERGNTEWESRWGDMLSRLEREALPSGSGIDSGTRIIREPASDGSDADADTCIRLSGSYHAMDSSGMYAGWFDYTIEARAAFSGLSVSLEWAGGETPEETYEPEAVPCSECAAWESVGADAGEIPCSECGGSGLQPGEQGDVDDTEWAGVSDPTDYLIDVYHSALSASTTRAEWEPYSDDDREADNDLHALTGVAPMPD